MVPTSLDDVLVLPSPQWGVEYVIKLRHHLDRQASFKRLTGWDRVVVADNNLHVGELFVPLCGVLLRHFDLFTSRE